MGNIERMKLVEDLLKQGLFQLSQEEIDALVQETLDLANSYQDPKILKLPNSEPDEQMDFFCSSPGYNVTIKGMNTDCDHEYVPYHGLKETFDYCKKCDAKK